MNHAVVLSAALPLTLFLMMFSMGIRLTPADFTRVAQQPSAIAMGLLCQMILLPLLMISLVLLLGLPPLIAVGFMVLSFAPGGATSNFLSHLAGGHLALSITLTAIVSLVTPLTIPWLTNLAIGWQLGEQADIQLPFVLALKQLVAVTVVPVLLGMLLRRFAPALCDRFDRMLVTLPLLMLAGVISGIIAQNWGRMPLLLAQTAIPCLLLAALAIAMGVLVARVAGLSPADSKTIGMETGIQNAGTAILVTGTLLQNADMTIAPVMYGVLMLVPALLYIVWQRLPFQAVAA